MSSPVDPGSHEATHLREDVIAWLTTVTPEGTPQSTPVWFWWDGEGFLVYSRPGKPKLRNLQANPRVGLHMVGDPTGEEIVVFEGEASIDPDAPPSDRHEGYAEKYREAIGGLGLDPPRFAALYSVPIRIRVTRARVE